MSMRDLLRARSEAPLEALELGPIIGRGSFGRVYKGEALRQPLRRAYTLTSHAYGLYAPEGCPTMLLLGGAFCKRLTAILPVNLGATWQWQFRVMSSMNGNCSGRWRAGSVAVKIINHDKHVGNNFDAMRESVLCSNINHPNVVMTYKASLCCLSS